MREYILTIEQQLRDGVALGTAHRLTGTHRRIISCGMGGSAVAGELLSMVRSDVIVHWDYQLPENAATDDLVICTSWSGATEETISSYAAARARGIPTLVITTGGALAAQAQHDGSPCIILPATNNVPRANIALMTATLFAALDLQQHIPTSLDVASLEQQGATLAQQIDGKMLAIYASYPYRKLTGIWKMVYSETAKRQVMANWFPSGAHNEVVGWEGPYQDSIAVMVLHDDASPKPYLANEQALLALLKEKGYTVCTVALSGDTLIEKALISYTLSLWTSFAVASLLAVDSQTTALLDEFKQAKASVR